MKNTDVIDFSEFIKDLPGEENSPGLVFYNNTAYIFLSKCICRIKDKDLVTPKDKILSVETESGFLYEINNFKIKEYIKNNAFDKYMKNYLYFDKKVLVEKIHEDSSRKNEKERKQLELVFMQNEQIQANIVSKSSQKFIAKITPERLRNSNIRFFEGSTIRHNLFSFYFVLLFGFPCCDIIGLKSNEVHTVLFYRDKSTRIQWQFNMEESIHKIREGV